MSSIMRWRNGLLGLSIIAKAPVSHGVEPHYLETDLARRLSYSVFTNLAASRRRYRASGLVQWCRAADRH
jgi:hypothetical protein